MAGPRVAGAVREDAMHPTRRHLLARALLLLRELGNVGTARATHAAAPIPLQNGAIYVLSRLVAADGVRPRDLLPSVHLTSGGLSNLLGRLDQAGLIARTTARAEDRRAVVVSITAEGRELERRVANACADAVRDADALVKELIVVLVEAGAVPSSISLPDAATSETRVALGLVELTMRTTNGIPVGDGVDAADANAALTLATLDHRGPCRPRSLSDVLQLTSGGTSRLIDRLEDAGYVERNREGVETDHRGVVVAITPAGIDHLSAVLESLAAHLDDLLGLLRAIWVEVNGGDGE